MSDRAVAPEFALLATIWRHRGMVIALALLCAVVGAAAYLLKPPRYEAAASLMFRFEREYFPENPANDGWEGDAIRVALDEAIHTEMEILGSRELLADALERAGGVEAWRVSGTSPMKNVLTAVGVPPYTVHHIRSALSPATWLERLGWTSPTAAAPPPADDVGVLAAVRGALSLRRIEGTMVVDVAMRHPDGAFAERFVAALIEAYLDRRRAIFGTPPLDAMNAEMESARERLRQAEETLVTYRARRGLFDFDRQRGALLDQLNTVRTTLETEIQTRITSTSDFIARAETAGEDPVGARVTLAGLESERAQLLGQQDRLERELAALMAYAPTLNDLERAVTTAQADFERVEALVNDRALRARLATAAGPVISVIDPPARTPGTAGLSLAATVAVTAAIGAVLGALLVLWRSARAPAVDNQPMLAPAADLEPTPSQPRRAAAQGAMPAFEPELDEFATIRRRRR